MACSVPRERRGRMTISSGNADQHKKERIVLKEAMESISKNSEVCRFAPNYAVCRTDALKGACPVWEEAVGKGACPTYSLVDQGRRSKQRDLARRLLHFLCLHK